MFGRSSVLTSPATGFPARASSLIISVRSSHAIPPPNAPFTAASTASTCVRLYSISVAASSWVCRSFSSARTLASWSRLTFSSFLAAALALFSRCDLSRLASNDAKNRSRAPSNPPSTDAVAYTFWSNCERDPPSGKSSNGNGEKSSKSASRLGDSSSPPSSLSLRRHVTTPHGTTSPPDTPSNHVSIAPSERSKASIWGCVNGSFSAPPWSRPASLAALSTTGGPYPNALHSASRTVPGARAAALASVPSLTSLSSLPSSALMSAGPSTRVCCLNLSFG